MNRIGTMLSGGELFGEGMYGCIFRPSLRCKDPSKQPKPTKDKIHPPLSKIIIKQMLKDINIAFESGVTLLVTIIGAMGVEKIISFRAD